MSLISLCSLMLVTSTMAAWTKHTPNADGEAKKWNAITSSDDGTKLAATIQGQGLFLSSDSGATWTEGPSNTNGMNRITSSADGSKLAGTVGTYIWTSADSGNSWTKATSPSEQFGWNDITSSADGTKLAACAIGSKIYLSQNSGATWALVSNDNAKVSNFKANSKAGNMEGKTYMQAHRDYFSITSSSDGVLLFAGALGKNIFKSTNSSVGDSSVWTEDDTVGFNFGYGITSSDDGTKLAATAGAASSAPGVWLSSDSGLNWTATSIVGASSQEWGEITSSADGSTIAALARAGNIWISTDSGASWTEDTSGPRYHLKAITMSADGTMIAAVQSPGHLWINRKWTPPPPPSPSTDESDESLAPLVALAPLVGGIAGGAALLLVLAL